MSYPNWFAHYAEGFFEKHLAALAGKPNLRFLQIGAFTGDASLWLLENVLTGPGAVLVDVDTWEGSDEVEHAPYDFKDVERTYDARTADHVAVGRLVKFKSASADFFRGSREPFDFIYIDGDHTAVGVLNDAINAYRLLKPGGLIAFDDYLWKSGKGRLSDPAPAIDAFADLYGDRLTLLRQGLQVWLRKNLDTPTTGRGA